MSGPIVKAVLAKVLAHSGADRMRARGEAGGGADMSSHSASS